MATIYAKRAQAPKPMRVDGNAVYLIDEAVISANPTANDLVRFRIPAGFEVANVAIQCDDMDSSTGMVFGVGYSPVDSASSLSPSATYFAAAGQTNAQSGARLVCSFKPLKFEEDVWLELKWGAAASGTFTAGSVFAIVGGNQVGVK